MWLNSTTNNLLNHPTVESASQQELNLITFTKEDIFIHYQSTIANSFQDKYNGSYIQYILFSFLQQYNDK